MKKIVYPSLNTGSIAAPSSKSFAHRALIAASLSAGTSVIYNLGHSKDIEATVGALRCLGANIEVKDNTATVKGCNPLNAKSTEIFCNESGSTLRFLIPVFSLNNQRQRFTGAGRLLSRPQDIYQTLYAENGLTFIQNEKEIVVQGPLKSGHYKLSGAISSQFFTGLLFALPLVEGNTILEIEEPFESRSYIDCTLEVLKEFGISIVWKDRNTLLIYGNQKYIAKDYTVEADYSSAAFFALLGAINKPMRITGLKKDSVQGDKAILDIIEKTGGKVEWQSDEVAVMAMDQKDCDIDLADCPDLGPAVMVLASVLNQKITLNNIARLRYKESDRVMAMQSELKKAGYSFVAEENKIHFPAELCKIRAESIEIDSHNDHRIAMSMAILATVSEVPFVIDNAECVNKSYPDFWKDLERAGIKVEDKE